MFLCSDANQRTPTRTHPAGRERLVHAAVVIAWRRPSLLLLRRPSVHRTCCERENAILSRLFSSPLLLFSRAPVSRSETSSSFVLLLLAAHRLFLGRRRRDGDGG